ncbi:hypothetical protein F511_13019 [Dorcoceras hygrometricum]|uniref:Uncharacterized protein n=1 Tax=Dorcoceras hygrometricum TaxID=472368 RepID=A0A2Z7AU49_9LAMI|nr:hypothetical protein F511_13019 [Dorcoceras hygrometricum]
MRDGSYPHASRFKVYGSYPLVLKPSILLRAYTAKHIIHAQPLVVTKLNIRTLTSELCLAHADCHNESPSNTDPLPTKPIQATAQGLQLRTTAAWSYDSTSANSVRPKHSAVQMLIGIGPVVSRCAYSSHRNWPVVAAIRVLSVAGASTSSFRLVGTTAF